jgi:hypothetical protein
MLIKKYLEFIKESENNSFGEWVESLSNDDYIMNIINRFIGDVSPTIRLANAINLLDDKDKSDIKNQINNYLEFGIEEKEPEVIASAETEELLSEQVQSEISVAGKGIFHSFLKALTALGRKETNSNPDKCPDDFLIFYHYENLLAEEVKIIFNRFKSLGRYTDMIDYGKNEVELYFGIKCNGQFQYGISYDNNLSLIGEFKLSQSTIKWILSLESKSAFSLKKDLVNLSYNDILTLGKIKMDMINFNPGYHEKKSFPVIRDRVISFGWYGVGKWDNGKLDSGELMNVKNNFNTWVMSKKWGTKILVSVNPQSFWLWIHIKLK